jgi:hypothetical protein
LINTGIKLLINSTESASTNRAAPGSLYTCTEDHVTLCLTIGLNACDSCSRGCRRANSCRCSCCSGCCGSRGCCCRGCCCCGSRSCCWRDSWDNCIYPAVQGSFLNQSKLTYDSKGKLIIQLGQLKGPFLINSATSA